MRSLVVALTLCSCVGSDPVGPADPNTGPADPSTDPTDPDPESNVPISVVLDHLEPGWLVTTTVSANSSEPTEQTIVSDGSPITLTGDAHSVFSAFVTDPAGALITQRV